MFFDEGQLHVQTEEGKKITDVKTKKQCNKSSLTKEKECCKCDKTRTASLLNGLKI